MFYGYFSNFIFHQLINKSANLETMPMQACPSQRETCTIYFLYQVILVNQGTTVSYPAHLEELEK